MATFLSGSDGRLQVSGEGKSFALAFLLCNVGDGVVGERDDGAGRPVGLGRPALGGQRLPALQVLEDAAHDRGVVDERDHPHWALADGTDERVGLVDLADEPRPGCLGPCRNLARRFGRGGGRRGRVLCRRPLGPFAAHAVRVPACVPDEVFVAIGNVAAEELEPLGPGHELEVALEAFVHLRAIDDRAAGRVVGHLLERHRSSQHVAGELAAARGIVHAHLVKAAATK